MVELVWCDNKKKVVELQVAVVPCPFLAPSHCSLPSDQMHYISGHGVFVSALVCRG